MMSKLTSQIWKKKIKDAGINAIVSKFESLEEVLILYGLPLTNDIEGLKSIIIETIAPFVKRVGEVFPCKYGATAGEFFEGKLNGNWRVRVNPKPDRQVPNFIVLGAETKVMVKAKYVRNEFERKEMCSDCFSTEHFRNHEECPGLKDWEEYCREFSDHWEMCRLDTDESEDQIIARNEHDSRHMVLSRQLQKDLENLEQEKLLMETRLREQHELCEKVKRLEEDNQRYRQLGNLLRGRRRVTQSLSLAGGTHSSLDGLAHSANEGIKRAHSKPNLHFSDKKVCDRLESVTDPSFLSRSDDESDDGNDDDLANGMEYDHDYLSDPLNATVVPSEEDSIEPLINSEIIIKGEDGVVVHLVVLEKKPGPGDDENHYILREYDSDRQITLDLTKYDWKPIRNEESDEDSEDI